MSRYDLQNGGEVSSTVVKKALEETKDLNADYLEGNDSTTLALKLDMLKDVSNKSFNTLKLINRPSITLPISGSENIIDRRIIADDYQVSNFYNGDHSFSIWEVSTDPDFNTIIESVIKTDQLTEWLDPNIKNNTTYYVRVRYGSDIHISDWSPVVMFTTGILTKIKTPELFISGEPDNIGIAPVLTTSPFEIIGAPETHISTHWIIENIFGDNVLDYVGTGSELTQLTVPDDLLNVNSQYTFKVSHQTANYQSDFGEKTVTILPSIIIDTPELDIQGRPDNISVTPTITASNFNVSKGTDIHVSTDWVIENTVGTTLWTSLDNTVDLLSITIPSGVLEIDTPYFFKCRFNGLQAKSNFGKINGTTGEVFYENIWDLIGSFPVPIEGHGLSKSGNKLIVTGGYINSVTSNDLYSSIDAINWTKESSLPGPTADHIQVTLNDGRIFICGGVHNLTPVLLGYIYNPNDNSWVPTSPMPTYRYLHSATVLRNGLVLISGGYNGTSKYDTCSLYDPINDRWFSARSMPEKRAGHSSVTLKSGRVLVSGGVSGSYSSNCLLYIYESDTWTTTAALPENLSNHRMSLLPNGMVLLTGGIDGTVRSKAYLFDENSHSWTNISDLINNVSKHGQITNDDGHVILVGGNNGNRSISTIQRYK